MGNPFITFMLMRKIMKSWHGYTVAKREKNLLGLSDSETPASSQASDDET
jgi:hypothetical protein